MAQSPEEIQEQLVQQVLESGSTLDVDKGPIYDVLLKPTGPVISNVSAEAERVALLVSQQFSDVATEDEANALASAFGVNPSEGGVSSGRVLYYCFTKPLIDRPVPRGSLVGTRDGTFLYYVTDDSAILRADYADSYYNATTGRYEITVNILATASGEDYDIPAGKIDNMVTPLDGFDGVINTVKTSGGSPSQTSEELVTRIQAKFLGLNPESGGGIKTTAYEYAPDLVKDVRLVYPSDRDVFKRLTNRPSIDIYIKGENLTDEVDSYIALGGETTFQLVNQPTHTVSKVLVNGVETDAYSFVLDESWQTGGTVSSLSYVILDAPLILGDEIAITYSYNKLIADLQVEAFSIDQERPFDTELIVREFREIPITIVINVKVLSSFTPSKVVEYVESYVYDYIEPDSWTELLQPETLKESLVQNIAGLSTVVIKKFTRTTGGSVDVETITLSKVEISKVDQDYFVVNVV